jgi:hypothetical protein
MTRPSQQTKRGSFEYLAAQTGISRPPNAKMVTPGGTGKGRKRYTKAVIMAGLAKLAEESLKDLNKTLEAPLQQEISASEQRDGYEDD